MTFAEALKAHRGAGHEGLWADCQDPGCVAVWAACLEREPHRRVRGGLLDPPLSTGRPPRGWNR